MAKILLINPSYTGTYASTKVGMINPIMPTLGLATIAAEALRRGHQVKILDLSHTPYDWRSVQEHILQHGADIVGITATTPLMNQLRDISVLCKDISRDILVIGGGAHLAALPYESMMESMLDIAIPGEADIIFGEIADGHAPASISGIYYRRDRQDIRYTGPRPPIHNLDDLPMPAWHLYDPAYYKHKVSRLYASHPPLTTAEFSRGCVFKCDFCASKMTMAWGYRKKSPRRCSEEVKLMHSLGWREFMLADDIFSSDHAWAVAVSEAIVHSGVRMAWTCTNGIRVESADDRLFQTMRRAGCYRVSFGFESGNDEVLKSFGKGGKASIVQGRRAVMMARKAHIDTNGFFLLGLSADTHDTMLESIEYARSLELDMLKFSVTIPFPGTPMFNRYVRRGLITSFDWDAYHQYTDAQLFKHPDFTYEDILKFLKIAFRRTILTNPGFIRRRLMRGVRTGEFFWDLYYLPKFLLASTQNSTHATQYAYYARDRWPVHDFLRHPPAERDYPIVQKPKKNTADPKAR